MPTTLNLDEIRRAAGVYMEKWKKNGGETGKWTCPHCEKENETTTPKENQLGKDRTFWDSCTICLNCGETSFLQMYPGGRVRVTKMEIGGVE